MTIKVDLLPTEKKGFRIDPMVIILLLLIIAANVGFAFYGQQLTAKIETKQTEVKKVQDEKKQIEASLPVIEERRARIRKLQEQIEVIKSLVHDPVRYANLLQEVAYVLPPNVWLSNLSIEPGSNSVQMAGNAAEVQGRLPLATVAQLMKNLNESKYFSDASLASTNEANAEGHSGFSFQLTVHYDPQAAAQLPPTGVDTPPPAEGAPTPAGDPNAAPPTDAGTPTPAATGTP